jgi:O-antigen/teichoic acid export membrane protein/rubredoxin
MKSLVRCKVCGYITTANKLGEVCPACGVLQKMFEPYTPTLSEKRLQWLQLDLHPIIVHFPQAYALTLLVLSLVGIFALGGFRDLVAKTFTLLAFCLPFVVAGGLLTGLLDGQNRFKKITTPILQTKLALGVTFLLLAVALVFVSQGWTALDPQSPGMQVFLTAGCFICSAFLGLLGSSITNAWLPG